MNQEQKDMIVKLKKLSKNARKAPWGYGGQPRASGEYSVYRLHKPEEDLIIIMRNHIDELIAIIENNL